MDTTIFLDISAYEQMLQFNSKKSFTIKDLDDYDIPYFVLPQKKIRVNYRYDIESLLNSRIELMEDQK